MELAGPADLAAGLGVWVVGLGGLEPPTSSLSGIISQGRYVLRPRSAALPICPRVAVRIPEQPSDRARVGHDIHRSVGYGRIVQDRRAVAVTCARLSTAGSPAAGPAVVRAIALG